MRIRLVAWNDRLRSSLFFQPMLFIVGAVLLGASMLWIDEQIESDATQLPLGLTSTVESARSVLSTVASATMTVAGIAFSVTLLVLQLASSQYSPRVIQGLFRDSVNKFVLGLVVGTFTYCLVVLRSVRSSVEEGGEPVIPNISVGVAVLLGVASVLAIVAFINHNAHRIDVSKILDTVTRQTVEKLAEAWPAIDDQSQDDAPRAGETVWPMSEPYDVTFDRDGWIQHIDLRQIVAALPERGRARVRLATGQYAVRGAPLCSIWPWPDEDTADAIVDTVRGAVHIGATRTMAQDASYGVRQLADVALKALSPGINDPTTAHDAIAHLGTVLAEAYRRRPPPQRTTGDDGRQVELLGVLDHAELTELAFAEIRRVAAPHPRVVMYLLDTMATLLTTIQPHQCSGCTPELHRQAEMAVAGCAAADVLPEDLAEVRDAYERLFGQSRPAATGAAPGGSPGGYRRLTT